jgi:hypothetical protein
MTLPLSLACCRSLAFGLGAPRATLERCRRGLGTTHRNGPRDAIARQWP